MFLIGICGKKQSGKTTLAKALVKQYRENGKKATIMSMATPLKEFCEDYLELTHEQLYGTEEQKNSLTKYKWEDLPHYQDIVERIRVEETNKAKEELKKEPWWCRFFDKNTGFLEYNIENRIALRLPFGYMKAREVIQEWGTGIFRKINPLFWVNKAKEMIKEDQSYNNDIRPSDVIIFDDVRFEDECDLIISREISWGNGILVKLLRDVGAKDPHKSENLNYSKYDIIIPDGLNRDETLEFLNKGIEQWKN